MIDALRYEWVRLTTIKSTYWLIGLTLAVQTVVALLIAWAVSDGTFKQPDEVFGWVVTTGASLGLAPLVVAYLTGILGVLAFGHEYRYGTVRSTLTALPSRLNVFLAKVLTTGALAGFIGVFCVATGVLALVAFGLDMPSGESFQQVSLGTVFYLVLFIWWGLAIAALTRNQTFAVALMLLAPTVLEFMIKTALTIYKAVSGSVQEGGIADIVKFLPFDAGSRMYTQTSIGQIFEVLGIVPFGPVGGGLVMATFVGLLLAWAGLWFVRKDA